MIYNYPYYNSLNQSRFTQGNYYYPPKANYKYIPVQTTTTRNYEIPKPIKIQKTNTKTKVKETQLRTYNYETNKKNNFDTNTDKINKKQDNCIFEILGIKLYFDDILLLCLIFFLYNEGVKDQSLFMILILLLLS